jgi:hypothetical protein
MIGQYLPNNNETATVAFRQKFCQLNSPYKKDIDHLFFSCNFAPLWCNPKFATLYLLSKSSPNLSFFMEAVLIDNWKLWKLQSDKVFEEDIWDIVTESAMLAFQVN